MVDICKIFSEFLLMWNKYLSVFYKWCKSHERRYNHKLQDPGEHMHNTNHSL